MTADNALGSLSLVMLAPDLASTGGIQASGRIAWQSIHQTLADDPGNGAPSAPGHGPRLLCYGSVPPTLGGDVAEAVSQSALMLKALHRKRSADAVLVWHLSLLR